MQKKHLTNSIIKHFSKLGTEGNYLHKIKPLDEKPTANIRLSAFSNSKLPT